MDKIMNTQQSANYRILLVDDEPDILEFVGYNLRREGYEVTTAANGREAVARALETEPHLILLDVMMPEMDGIEACLQIRSRPALARTMIAFLTARGEDYSQIAGFDSGADDYITKPIKMKVLMSRIKALLKRMDNPAAEAAGDDGAREIVGMGSRVSSRAMVIDRERYFVVKDGREIVLPRKEFNLLALLYSKPQKVFSREEIFSSVWGDDVIVGDRTIDVQHSKTPREDWGGAYCYG